MPPDSAEFGAVASLASRSQSALDTAHWEYRGRVLKELTGTKWSAPVERAGAEAQKRLRAARLGALAPTWARGMAAALKPLFFLVAPLLLAHRLWARGVHWTAVPLLLLSSMAFYGAMSVLHDLAHDSLLPSKRANAFFGTLLAPVLLLEFSNFRKSHLGHHRFSQSDADPKRFGAERNPDSRLPDYRTVEHVPVLARPLLHLGTAVSRLPLGLRHVIYGVGTLALLGPLLLLIGGEFSIPGRDWRRVRSWLALATSAAMLSLLYRVSPSLLVMSAIVASIGFAFVFTVFAGHITPHQVYWMTDRKSSVADSLNVSDVRFGALPRWLSHGFADHHSTHHISPAIPSYHLAAAAELAALDGNALQAPPLNLLKAAHCALLLDNLVLSFTLDTTGAWEINGDAAVRRIKPL